MHRNVSTALLGGLVMLLPWLCAAADQADPAKPTPEETQAHHAKGEVHYGGKWMPMIGLVEGCRTIRATITSESEATKPTKDRITEINKAAGQALAEWKTAKRPVERELAQAEAKRSTAQRVLSARPPAKPKLIKKLRGHSGDRRASDHIDRQNRQRQKEYEQAMKRYNELRKQAKKAYDEADAAVTKLRKQLDGLRTQLKETQKPMLAERTQLTAESRSAGSRAAALMARVRVMSDILAAVPERDRLKQGIALWRGAFYQVAELEDLHAAIVAEVEAGRSAAEARLTGQGATLPESWRHPRQAVADALKALIAGTKADMADGK